MNKIKDTLIAEIKDTEKRLEDLKAVLSYVCDIESGYVNDSCSKTVLPSIQDLLVTDNGEDDGRVHMDDYRNMQTKDAMAEGFKAAKEYAKSLQESLEEADNELKVNISNASGDSTNTEEVNPHKVDMRTGTYAHTVYEKLLKACKDKEWYTVKSLVNYMERTSNYSYVNSNRVAQALYTLWKNGYIVRRTVAGKKRLSEYKALKLKTFY